MKNLGGRLLASLSTPDYAAMAGSGWKTADVRAALGKRLAALGAEK